jgi:hypothetical protein
MRPTWIAMIAIFAGAVLAGCSLTEGIRVDLRGNSTAGGPSSSMVPPLTRNQGGRNTCQTFGAIAALEAAYKRQYGLELDLSEEFTNYSGKMFWLSFERYGAALPAEATETQLSAWGGGGGTGWLNNLSHGFAVPIETTMPYRGSYSLVPYCGEDCGWGTESYTEFAATQRNVDSFNLNQTNLPLTALTSDAYYSVRSYVEIDATDPAAIIRALDEGYEVVWDFWVLGYRGGDPADPIWQPRIFTEEMAITRGEDGDEDKLPRRPVRAILEVKQGDIVYEAGSDWEQNGDFVRWLGTDRPEAGSDYTVKWRHEGGGGSHVMLIIGYNPSLRYFIVKNSWDTGGTADLDMDGARDGWTLISYNYVRSYGIQASYITEVNPPRPWPELPFVGRWNLSFDGFHGVLDIYHMPGIMQHILDGAYAADPGGYPGADATDRRLGVYFDSSGQAYRVNGSVEGNHITFYIDMEDPDMPIDQLSGRRFDYYYFRDDVDWMAGFHQDPEGGERWGGYALRCPPGTWPACGADWLASDFDSPRPFTPESWVGRWNVNYDGIETELVINGRDDSLVAADIGYAGLAAEFLEGGFARPTTVRVSLDNPSFLYLDLGRPGSTRRAELRHLSWESGVAAGSYVGVPETSFGVTMVRTSSPLVAEIVSPTSRLLSRAQTHLFDVDVLHDPAVDCCTYQWTSSLDGELSDDESFTRVGTAFTPGVHSVRVTVRDAAGSTASDEIEIEFPENAAPDVEILTPANGATFFQSQTISLTGQSVDTDHPPAFRLDEDEVFWYLDSSSSPFDGGHTAALSGLSLGAHTITFYGDDGLDTDSDRITVQIEADPVDLPPNATILSPSHGATFNANAQDGGGQWYINVTLTGQGIDPEDGTLSGASLVWRDSVNGGPAQVIGTGASITVPLGAPNCFGNTHTITLTVTDSEGHTSTASITITVSLLC